MEGAPGTDLSTQRPHRGTASRSRMRWPAATGNGNHRIVPALVTARG